MTMIVCLQVLNRNVSLYKQLTNETGTLLNCSVLLNCNVTKLLKYQQKIYVLQQHSARMCTSNRITKPET